MVGTLKVRLLAPESPGETVTIFVMAVLCTGMYACLCQMEVKSLCFINLHKNNLI